jgi:hypothetical protein
METKHGDRKPDDTRSIYVTWHTRRRLTSVDIDIQSIVAGNPENLRKIDGFSSHAAILEKKYEDLIDK